MSALLLKKLKVFSSAPGSNVYVWQDGSGTDADATSGHQYDDGFQLGALHATETQTDNAARVYVDLQSLRREWEEGSSLTFRVIGGDHWWANPVGGLHFQPNDRIEFWARRGTQYPSVDTPSWHLNEESDLQVRYLNAWVQNVKVTSEPGALEITARDAIWYANHVATVKRAGQEGIDIPRAAFNVDGGRDNPEYFYSVKKTSATTYGTGESDQSDAKMTVGEILDWLGDEVGSQFQTENIVAISSAVFAGTGALSLTPGQIVLDATSWVDAVKQVLQYYPQLRLWYDSRDRIFRFVEAFTSLVGTATTNSSPLNNITPSGTGWQSQCHMTDETLFSATPGEDGNRLRAFNVNQPEISQELTVYSIGDVAANLVRFVEAIESPYAVGSTFAPLEGSALDTFTFSADDSASVDQDWDLDGTYSAVNITSVNQKTVTRTYDWRSADPSGSTLEKQWDDNFESFWIPEDAGRTEGDNGRAGLGMEVYDIDKTGTVDVLKIKYSESKYLGRHTDNEWQGCAVWVRTKAGGNDVTDDRLAFNILSQVETADVGDGSSGMLLEINTTDFVFDVGGSFGSTVVPVGSVADRVSITCDFSFNAVTTGVVTDWNQRSKVGVNWSIKDSSRALNTGSSRHLTVCNRLRAVATGTSAPPGVWTPQGPQQGHPSGLITTRDGWQQLAGGGLGSFFVWRRAFRAPEPVHNPARKPAGCSTPGWAGPTSFQITAEETTTTVRSARYPAAGYGGTANIMYGLDRVKEISANDWIADSQNSDFEELARNLWRFLQHAHSRGTLVRHGIYEHAVLFDLAGRVGLTTGRGVAGSAPTIQGFQGFMTDVSIDFREDRVTVGMDNGAGWNRIPFNTLKDVLVRDVSRVNELESRLSQLQQQVQCAGQDRPYANPGRVCSTKVLHGPTNIGAGGGSEPTKANVDLGIVGTNLEYSADGADSGVSSLGVNATHPVVRDHHGQAFVIGPDYSVHPVSVSGVTATLDLNSTNRLTGLGGATSQRLQGALGFLFGPDSYQWSGVPVQSPVVASTTTSVRVSYNGMATNEFASGTLIVYEHDEDLGRPLTYTIASNSSNNFTLSSAMPEGAVTAGALVIAVHQTPPKPDATDFPDGAIVLKDSSANWIAMEPDGTTWRASVSGDVATKDVSSGAVNLEIGGALGSNNTGTLITAVGASWNFSGVSIKGGAPSSGEEFVNMDYADGNVGGNAYTESGIAAKDMLVHTGGSLGYENTPPSALMKVTPGTEYGPDESQLSTDNFKNWDTSGRADDDVVAYQSSNTKNVYKTLHADYAWHVKWEPRATVDLGGGTLVEADSSPDDPTGYNSHTSIHGWDDGNKEGASVNFPVPRELDLTQTVKAYLYFRRNTSAGGDVEIEWDIRAVGTNENTRTEGTTFSGAAIETIPAGGGGDLIRVDLGTVFGASTLSYGEWVKGVIFRDATAGNADDTWTGIVQAMGIEFVGTRKLYA